MLLIDAESGKTGSNDMQWGHHPLGLMYLAANVTAVHPDVRFRIFHTLTSPDVLRELTDMLQSFQPDAVGVRCLNRFKKNMEEIVRHIRSLCPRIPIIAGGPYPTAAYDEVLSNHNADMVIIGEGELTLLDIVEQMEPHGPIPPDIPGTAVLEGGTVKKNGARPYMDVNRLASPDYGLIDLKAYGHVYNQAFLSSSDCAYLFSSRGCPFRCGYCHDMFGKQVRRISPERIMEEIRAHIEQRGLRDFVFVDDIFNVPLESGKAVLRMICKEFSKEQIRLYFPNGLRADAIDDEFIELLERANTQQLSLAIETAVPRLQRFIGKNLDLERAKRTIDKLSPRFITTVLFMTGFPTETMEEALRTITFAAGLEYVAQPVLSVLRVFPETPVYKWLQLSPEESDKLKRQAEMQFAPKLLDELKRTDERAFYGDFLAADQVPLKSPDIRQLEYIWIKKVLYNKTRLQKSHFVIQKFRTGKDLLDYYRFLLGNGSLTMLDVRRLVHSRMHT